MLADAPLHGELVLPICRESEPFGEPGRCGHIDESGRSISQLIR